MIRLFSVSLKAFPLSSPPLPRLTLQYSQMRDEVFKSNLVCAFIVLIFITTIQSLLPSTR